MHRAVRRAVLGGAQQRVGGLGHGLHLRVDGLVVGIRQVNAMADARIGRREDRKVHLALVVVVGVQATQKAVSLRHEGLDKVLRAELTLPELLSRVSQHLGVVAQAAMNAQPAPGQTLNGWMLGPAASGVTRDGAGRGRK